MRRFAKSLNRRKILALFVCGFVVVVLVVVGAGRFMTPKMLQSDEQGGGAEYRIPLAWEETIDGESCSLTGVASVGPEWFGKRAVRVDATYKIGKGSSQIRSVLGPIKGSGDCFASLSLDAADDNEQIAQPFWNTIRGSSTEPKDCKWLKCQTYSLAMDFAERSYQGTLCFQAWTDASFFERGSTDTPVSFSFLVDYPSGDPVVLDCKRYDIDLTR